MLLLLFLSFSSITNPNLLLKLNSPLRSLSGSSHCGTAEMILTSNHEIASSIPGLAQQVKDLALP